MLQRSSFGLGRTVCGLAVCVSCLVTGEIRGEIFEKGRPATVEPLVGDRCLVAPVVEQGADETLGALRDRVRKLSAAERANGVEVRLRAGDIELEQGVVFTAADEGLHARRPLQGALPVRLRLHRRQLQEGTGGGR